MYVLTAVSANVTLHLALCQLANASIGKIQKKIFKKDLPFVFFGCSMFWKVSNAKMTNGRHTKYCSQIVEGSTVLAKLHFLIIFMPYFNILSSIGLVH